MSTAHLPRTEAEQLSGNPAQRVEARHQQGAEDASREVLQLLAPDGGRRQNSTFSPFAEALSSAQLRQFYRDMALARRFDQEATALQRQGELAMWVPMVGQEAAQVGSGRASRPEDYLFPTYREHAVAMTRGVNPSQLLGLFRGVSHGGWDPRQNNFHLYTLVLAAQTLHAVGYAMGVQRDRAAGLTESPAVLAYFGDGSSSEGDVHESMVFAASFQAPVVFFCQNNRWAISVPFSVQSRVPLAQRAAGYGFPGLRVDGNDVLAVYAASQWALEHARSGAGPVLIEAETYRLGAHTTADDPSKYRGSDEEEQWRLRDPLLRLETLLRAEGHADDAFFDDLGQEGDQLASDVRREVLAMVNPDLRASFANVYAQQHPLIAEELAWLEEYEAGFVTEGE
ncbi:pyruvate dehydrogenase (acetyl-transferring) E1 component subunit alpha [Psychromicrobium lacuslunae]|uniref:Pyruvate dehydrogenase n=1 Tax=Psychromicrobium lacuslunae TaxID=1618207 RepID=A0A0D4C093_9MICC|nr:pyruvate dehydrogenase (acetyl-transferring) E1 component subunit alpha [Psychromicrobium lacuslunae]AJT42087.1 pyruvate dehydrogenase [Psychromicrobium lacuslunae]